MPTLVLFATLVLLNFLLSFGINHFVLTEDVYYYALIDTLSEERIHELLSSQKKYEWILYSFGPVVYALKLFLMAACTYTGFFFRNMTVKFSTLFEVALRSEFLFLLIPATRLIWFMFFDQNYSLDNVSEFPPYTAVSLFDSNALAFWIKYPLSFINLLQVAYILIMAKGISNDLEMKYSDSAALVLQTYGVALLIWILFTLFLLISYS
jgi:hypothetical protein